MGKKSDLKQVKGGTPRTNQLALMEDYLIRLITQQDSHPDVLAGDWQLLEDWKEGRNCRLLWESVISHAIDPQSPYYDRAQRIITEEENLSLPTAVAINHARYSLSSRQAVLINYIDRFGLSNILPTDEIQRLWEIIKPLGVTPSAWGFIAKATGLINWETTPPEHEIELWDACRRTLHNPLTESIFSMVYELTEMPNFDKMPKLKRRILELALWPEGKSVLGFVQKNFKLLVDAIVNLLVKFDLPESMLDGRQPDDLTFCYRSLDTYSMIVSNCLPYSKESSKLKPLLESLNSGAQYPWNWRIIAKILRSQENIPNKVDLIFSWLKAIMQNPVRNDNKDRIKFAIGSAEKDEYWKAFSTIVKKLSAQDAIELFGLIIKDKHMRDYAKIEPLLIKHPELVPTIKQMQKEQKYCQETLAYFVSSHQVSVDFVLRYYQALGLKKSREAILGWIERSDRQANLLPIITEIVVPNNLPAGNLLPKYARDLFDLDYQLKPEDIERETLRELLFTGGGQSRYCPIWDPNKPQWAQVLLRSEIGLEQTLTSLFESLPKIAVDQRDNFINTILLPACWDNKILTHAAGVSVWDSGESSATSAIFQQMRKIIATDPIFTNWIRAHGKRITINYFVKKMWHDFLITEKETANALFTKGEQRTIFFMNAVDDPKNNFEHLTSAYWRFLFDDEESQKRLCNWLFAKWAKLDPVNWMYWIEEFDFIGDSRLPNIIRGFLESSTPDVAATAAAIRQKIRQLKQK